MSSCDLRKSGKWVSWRAPTLLATALTLASSGLVQKYAGLPGVAIHFVLALLVISTAKHFLPAVATWMEKLNYWPAIAFLTISALLFAIVYPMEDSGKFGKSSDRDDGLNIAASRLLDGESPYYPSHPKAGPLSPLPGAIFIAIPFVILGNSALQNIFWLAALVAVGYRYFGKRVLAVFLPALMLGLSPSIAHEFLIGGDLIANAIYVPLAFLFVMETWGKASSHPILKFTSGLALGIALASRPNFLLLLPLLSAWLWSARDFKSAFSASLLSAVVSILITVPFYFNDPGGFTPLIARQKLTSIDGLIPHASTAALITTFIALGTAVILTLRKKKVCQPAFFKLCALITFTPLIVMMILISIAKRGLDFSFYIERFGVMPIVFVILGWGMEIMNRQAGTSPAGHHH